MKINTLELSKKLFERYESRIKVEAYYGLLAYYALSQTALVLKNKELINKCVSYYSLFPDGISHPHYNFKLYEFGGQGKPWLMMKGYFDDIEKLRYYAEITLKAPADDNGIMCMPGFEDNLKTWIDISAFVTPFMLYSGLVLKDNKYIDFAAQHCFKQYDLLLDKTCGLLHQSRGFLENLERVSADHWSRGNGWGVVGLAELVRYLPENSIHRPRAEKYFKNLLSSLLQYQTDCGLWRQEIPEELAWYESSGTGLILFAMGVGLRKNILDKGVFMPAFKKGIDALAGMCVTSDFATHRSCPGCLCPNDGSAKAYITEKFPQTDEVHSYGCFMLAFTEAYRNGITEVNIYDELN